MPEAATALRCACGYNICCEVRRTGEHVGFLVFVDNEPESEAYGQRIEHCPNCGEPLGLPLFFRKD